MRIRTGYSFRVAAGMIDDCFAKVKGLGWQCAPITDRASTFGWVRWNKMCKKADLKPIFGIELAVARDVFAKKPTVDYWTFLAIDDLSCVNELLKIATTQFRYEPLLSYEQASNAKGVIKIVGARSLLDDFAPADDLFIALSPSVSKGYVNEALKKGFKFVASSDNKFVSEKDEGFYEVLCGRGASTQTYSQWILTEDEWRHSVRRVADQELVDASLKNQTAIAETCNAKLKMAKMLSPVKEKTLEQMCREGAKKIGIDLNNPVYAARLERELKLIAEKEFEDYFYIIADLMQYARAVMLCGPARGSSCGSLVCFLLEITTVDPIQYGLLFERFIDITRNDLPDIDIDFSDQKRHLIFEYMEKRYGRERIARLGTVALFRPRSAIDEAGTALSVPRWMCEKVLDSLIVRSGGDSRAMQTLEDTIAATPAGRELIEKYPEIIVAARMEGHPRHYSQHAAGIVVTETAVTDFVAIDSRTGATHCDKKDAEDLNLLKIDALGLTQLSVFEDALEMAGKDLHFLERAPLDDKKAIDVLNNGQFSGIFQFNGPALQSICNQITVENLADIVSVTALARPGPMAGGGTNEWVKRKNKFSPITYPHPLFEPYLQETIGIITYQEQVMQICREVGGMSWEDVSVLRKAMSKSLGKEFFDQYGNKFKAGAIEKGVPAEVLDKVWDELCAYGAMGFNKSHAVAYGILSYWCAYMKAYFPFEFAAATLTHEADPEKQIRILREISNEGFDYVPVDKDLSINKWSAGFKDGKKFLVGPIQNVKGVGPKMVNAIMSARARGEPLPARAEKLLANATTEIDSLWPIRNAIQRVMPDPSARNIHSPSLPVIKIQTNGSEYQAMVFGVVQQIKPRDENEAVNVAKRGGEILKGATTSLNLTIADDTDRIFGKVDRFKFERLGKEIVNRGRPGKALYAFKGWVPPNFRMIRIEQVRFLGFIDEKGDVNVH